jgi:glycerol uptake facilitator-like aquaporin
MNLSNEQLASRVKSFAWRIGMMSVAFIFATISENIGMLELNPEVTILLGLFFGEVSKALNSHPKY